MTVQNHTHDGTASRLWERAALTQLTDASKRCAHAGDDFEACLGTLLDAAIFVTAADKGKLQLIDPLSGCLVVRAQRGFDQTLLEYFAYVCEDSDVTCGVALRKTQRVIVEDVRTDAMLAGKPAREVLLKAGVRAVQSTPLTSRAGRVVGMVCTHFARPTRLGERELSFMNVLAGQAADYLERKAASGC